MIGYLWVPLGFRSLGITESSLQCIGLSPHQQLPWAFQPTSSRSKSRKSNLCRSGQRSHLNFSDEVGQSEEEDVLAYTVSQLSISPENTIFHFLHLDVGEVGRFFRQITHAYIFQFCRACFWRPLCPRLVRITLKCWTTSGYQFKCDVHYEQIISLSIIFSWLSSVSYHGYHQGCLPDHQDYHFEHYFNLIIIYQLSWLSPGLLAISSRLSVWTLFLFLNISIVHQGCLPDHPDYLFEHYFYFRISVSFIRAACQIIQIIILSIISLSVIMVFTRAACQIIILNFIFNWLSFWAYQLSWRSSGLLARSSRLSVWTLFLFSNISIIHQGCLPDHPQQFPDDDPQ